MLVSHSDYLIFKTEGKRSRLGKVTSVIDKRTWEVVVANIFQDDPEKKEVFTLTRKDVVANMGKNPSGGTAYGCKVEPYLGTNESKNYGPIHFFTTLKPDESTILRKSLSKVVKWMGEQNLIYSANMPLNIHVRPESGKYSGSYKYCGKNMNAEGDVMTLRFKVGDWEAADHIIMHEMAHGIWFRLVPTDIRKAWIDHFLLAQTLAKAEVATLSKMRKTFVTSGLTVAKFLKDPNIGTAKDIYKEIFKYFKTKHKLSIENIDNLVLEGETFAELWPKDSISLTNVKLELTEYASTKVEEYFAEAIRLYYAGSKLPKSVKGLIKSTFAAIDQ